MTRALDTFLAVALLLGLSGLAVLAMPNGRITSAADVAAAPEYANRTSAAVAYNAIGLPLNNGIMSAKSLLEDVNAQTGGMAVEVLRWLPDTGYEVFNPGDRYPNNFPLKVGDPVFVAMQGAGASTYSVVGNVPQEGEVKFNLLGGTPCKYNFLTLPLDQGGISSASQLLSPITGIGDVVEVLTWDATTGYAVYNPRDRYPNDFAVSIGYPYFVCMSASKTWPQP